MTVHLSYAPNLRPSQMQICREYWSYEGQGYYYRHVKSICHRYDLSFDELFDILNLCEAYVEAVKCQHCQITYVAKVPADANFIQRQPSWICEACETLLNECPF